MNVDTVFKKFGCEREETEDRVGVRHPGRGSLFVLCFDFFFWTGQA